MHIRTFASIVVATLAVAACDSSTAPPSGARFPELTRQESKWKSQDLHDYLFDYEHQFAGAAQAARIYVSGDRVVGATDITTGSALSLDPSFAWPTVDSLFARARAALAAKDVNVSVTYDASLGYPTSIDVSPVEATPAGGSSSKASDLQSMVVLTAN